MACIITQISKIYNGQSLRAGVRDVPEGRFRLVQMKDVARGRGIVGAGLYRVNFKESAKLRLVRKGDILFVARAALGSCPYSVLVEEECDNLVASALFYIIRANTKLVLPAYLNWYINAPSFGGKFLRQHAVGTSVLNMPKPVLAQMPVVLPPLDVQHKLAAAIELIDTDYSIATELRHKRYRLVDALVKDFIKNGG